MDTRTYDVALVPDEFLATKAIEASEELRQFGSRFTLDGTEYYPHLSLYMLRIQPDELAQLQHVLKSLAQEITVTALSATAFCQKRGYIDVEYQKTPELEALQTRVLQIASSFRSGLLPHDAASLSSSTGMALESLETFGYKYTGELFRPHLTLTRLQDERPVPLSALGRIDQYHGAFAQLALFELDDDYACVRRLASYSLV